MLRSSDCMTLIDLWLISDLSRSALIALWPRKMKIDSSRQVWTERTDERTKISLYWAPVGAKKAGSALPGWSVPRSLGSVVLGPRHLAPAVVAAVGRGRAHGGGSGQALVVAAVVARVGAVVWVNCLGPATQQISTDINTILSIPWADKVGFPEAVGCGIEGWSGCDRLSCDWAHCCCLSVPQSWDVGEAAPGLPLSCVGGSVQSIIVTLPPRDQLGRLPGQAAGPHWGGSGAGRSGGARPGGRDGAAEREWLG